MKKGGESKLGRKEKNKEVVIIVDEERERELLDRIIS